MRRARSRVAVALVLLLVGVGLTASSASPATEKAAAPKQIRLAVFLASAANTYWTAALEGVRAAAKRRGNVSITVFDAQFNTNKQVNQLRDALVSRRFDAWFIGPNDGGPLTPTIRQAVGRNIKVACTLVPCGPDIRDTSVQIPGVVAQIGISFYDNGRDLGLLTRQACGNKNPCNVVWLPGLPQLPLEAARTAGLRSALTSRQKIVAIQPGGYLAAPALTATQNILQANRNVDVIVSSGDQMIVGAERAVRAAGRTAQIKLIGNGATIEGVRAIQEGRWFASAAYLPFSEAKVAASLLLRAADGEKIQGAAINPQDFSTLGTLITKANAAKFNPEFRA